MAESSLWRTLSNKLGRTGHWIRVENPVLPGTPDVNYCITSPYAEGWIELKAMDDWPKREETPLRVPHYSHEQRVWHLIRSSAGGRVFVLLRIDKSKEYLLFDGVTAARMLGNVKRSELVAAALVHSKGVFPTGAIFKELTR